MPQAVAKPSVEELRNQIREQANRIRTLAAKFSGDGNKWLQTEDRVAFQEASNRWDALNIELQVRNTELQSRSVNEGNPLPGQEDTIFQHRRDEDREDEARDFDMALAAWMRNAHGMQVPQAELEACTRARVSPFGSAFEIRLANRRPTLGREIRFSDDAHEQGMQDGRLSHAQRQEIIREMHSRGQATYTGPRGAVLTQNTFMPRLERTMKAFGPMMRTSEIMITQDGSEMSWPALNDVDNEGVQIGEEEQIEDGDMEFSAYTFRSYKFASKVIKVSHELIRDSYVELARIISEALGERLGRIVNRRATIGEGGSTLSGIVPGSSAGKTTGAGNAITFEELMELQASVDPAYREQPGLGWMMHSDVASYIMRVKDGEGRFIWTDPSKGILAGAQGMLLGAPVHLNSTMDNTLATGNRTALYGDLSAYKLRIVDRIRLRTLTERYADTDQVGFIALIEADGCLLNPSGTAALNPVRHLVQG